MKKAKEVSVVKKHFYALIVNTYTISLTGLDYEDGEFCLSFYRSEKYAGVKNVFFKDPENLYAVTAGLLARCGGELNREIGSVYVVLPQRFFRTRQTSYILDLKDKPVNMFDVEESLNACRVGIEDCSCIDCIPIAYRLGEDYIDNPIGQEGEKLETVAVSVGVFSRVEEFFADASKKLGADLVIVSAADLILEKLQSDIGTNKSPRILLNVNEGSVDVCYCEMRAVIAHKTIEIGTRQFIELLEKMFGTDEASATLLLGHLNFNAGDDGEYAVATSDGVGRFAVKEANTCVKKLLSYICGKIREEIELMTGDTILPVYITGSPLCFLRGANELIVQYLGLPVKALKPDYLQWNTPSDYVTVGLAERINREIVRRKTIWTEKTENFN
jgi:cell division ATPase FtsA